MGNLIEAVDRRGIATLTPNGPDRRDAFNDESVARPAAAPEPSAEKLEGLAAFPDKRTPAWCQG